MATIYDLDAPVLSMIFGLVSDVVTLQSCCKVSPRWMSIIQDMYKNKGMLYLCFNYD